jgi:hypothetical protein
MHWPRAAGDPRGGFFARSAQTFAVTFWIGASAAEPADANNDSIILKNERLAALAKLPVTAVWVHGGESRACTLQP